MSAPLSTDRQRVLRKQVCVDWSGSGEVTMEVPEHAGLAQHQLAVGFDAAPTAGELRVEGRPTGGSMWVALNAQLARLDVRATGAVALCYAGFFDALKLSFSTALAGATKVSAMLHSGDGLLVAQVDLRAAAEGLGTVTQSALDAAASAGTLAVGRGYLVSDGGKFALTDSPHSYLLFAPDSTGP